MTDKAEAKRLADAQASAVPLHELLASVPHDARLVIDDADGMGTRYIPIGRMAHEAAFILRRWPDGEPVMCPGRPDSRCNYDAQCGQVCNKCGRIHDGYANQNGTITSRGRTALPAESERIAALENDIHSCYPGCTRAGCVNERLREAIEEQGRIIETLMCGMPDDGTTPVIRRIAALEREVEALRADAERLNYLSTKTRRVTLCPPGDHGGADNEWLVAVEVGTDRYGAFDEEFFGNDLRAAIDAARSKTA